MYFKLQQLAFKIISYIVFEDISNRQIEDRMTVPAFIKELS